MNVSVSFTPPGEEGTHLQGILAREALLAVAAGKRLHGQMDPFVAFEVVVPVEALRTLVALEGTLLSGGSTGVVAVQAVGEMVTVAVAHVWWHATAAHHGQGRARLVHVAQDGARDLAVGGVGAHRRDRTRIKG
jgi:hypothetical protein